MSKASLVAIFLGFALMLVGIVLALPASASLYRIIVGTTLCWLSLPFFWLAKQVQ
jgi:hypothetical protein